MKKLVLLFALSISMVSIAQEFEIEAKKFPYYDVIEWKGKGAILLSKDPGTTTRRVNIVLAGNQESSVWDESFTPKNEEFYFISSENARYVYFLDNLELENGKVYLTQLNQAGNKKTMSVSMVAIAKKLGVPSWNDLELINIIVTDKALVHHFRYHDKKGKAIREYATFITHHNMLVYGAELGVIPEDELKKENVGNWDYIGFTGEKICFAARDIKNKENGWSIKGFSPKAKPVSEFFMKAPTEFIGVENIGFGTTGKYYLDDKKTIDKGLLTFINDKFYMVGGHGEDNSAELILYERFGDEWLELNKMKLSYFIPKKSLKLGLYPMNEGIGYH
ncbi:MAG: hypothetical protein HRT57_07730, partial [Crocinitomicaceae bacterium]|nr:hypothetical protein [Crocinitomicaceae bacterium]